MASPKSNPNEENAQLDTVLILAISGLIFVILMFAVLFFHYISLHYALLDGNSELLLDVDDLQETTGQLQSEIDELLTTTTDELSVEELQTLDQQLETVDDGLETLGMALEENTIDSAEDIAWLEDVTGVENVDTIQGNIDRTLLLIAWFIGIVGLVTALLLAVTLGTQPSPKKRPRLTRFSASSR